MVHALPVQLLVFGGFAKTQLFAQDWTGWGDQLGLEGKTMKAFLTATLAQGSIGDGR